MVLRRGQEARDHQLPDLQAGEGRPVLRKIFGPIKDWECICGKYKRIKHRGIVCDKCGVEVTQSRVRRERMGHIELAVPGRRTSGSSRACRAASATLLDMSLRDLERILYFEGYVVIDPGDTELERGRAAHRGASTARCATSTARTPSTPSMGAEAVRELLARIDLDELAEELRDHR